MGRVNFMLFLPRALAGLVIAATTTCATAAQSDTRKNSNEPPLTARQIYDRVSQSVVVVRAQTASGPLQGSAVAFTNGCAAAEAAKRCDPASTYFFTNAHVVRDAQAVTLIIGTQQIHAAVNYRDFEEDVAVLFADAVVLPVAEMASSNTLHVGDRVYAIGAPKGLDRTITEGIISALRAGRLIQTSAPISPGSSGGGLFDTAGRLIGITTFKVKDAEALSFAFAMDGYESLPKALFWSELILTGLQSRNDSEIRDRFAKWLLSREGNGPRHFENVSVLNERAIRGEITWGNYEEAVVKLFEQFQSHSQIAAGSSIRATNDTAPPQVIRLVCDLSFRDGGPFKTITYTIDTARKIANDRPATITPEQISWTIPREGNPDSFTVSIDRYSGKARVGTMADPSYTEGPCKKVESRAF